MKAMALVLSLVAACGIQRENGNTVECVRCDPDAGVGEPCSCIVLPSCADLGCPFAPSGTPDIWSPCPDDVCYCGPLLNQQCSRALDGL